MTAETLTLTAADAAALDPADAQREATAAADKAGRLAESDPLAAAFAYDRAAAMTRRTVALYAGHGKRGQVQDMAAAYDKRAFDLRAAYCKAAAREAAELESALAALPEGAAAYARECIAAGAEPAEAIEAGKAAERRARAEARAEARAAAQRPEEGRRVIDMTPTWAGLAPALFMALTNGTPEGQRIAREELTRALAALDAHNAAARGKVTLSLELQDAAALARILDFAGPRFHDLTPEQWQGLSDARETLAAALAQPVTA